MDFERCMMNCNIGCPVERKGAFASIVVNTVDPDLTYTVANQARTGEIAERTALKGCRERSSKPAHCKVIATFRGCSALVIGEANNQWTYWAKGTNGNRTRHDSEASAEAEVMQECRLEAPKCWVEMSICSDADSFNARGERGPME